MTQKLLLILALLALTQGQLVEEECKRDCSMDWLECVNECERDGHKAECHQFCQKVVHGCLGECPKILCLDHCRVEFEYCRDDKADIIDGVTEEHCNEEHILCQNDCDAFTVQHVVKDDF